MKFSAIAQTDIVVDNDIVILYPKNKIGKAQEAPFGLMCAAFMIRHALSFATMHNVPSRVVFDDDDKFICYVLTVGAPLSGGAVNYLVSVGFGDKVADVCSNYQFAAGQMSKRVRGWKWSARSVKRRRKRR